MAAHAAIVREATGAVKVVASEARRKVRLRANSGLSSVVASAVVVVRLHHRRAVVRLCRTTAGSRETGERGYAVPSKPSLQCFLHACRQYDSV